MNSRSSASMVALPWAYARSVSLVTTKIYSRVRHRGRGRLGVRKRVGVRGIVRERVRIRVGAGTWVRIRARARVGVRKQVRVGAGLRVRQTSRRGTPRAMASSMATPGYG